MQSTVIFLAAALAIFAMGTMVNGQQAPCYETGCLVFNTARCDGNEEKKSTKCGFPNKQRKVCCQHNKKCGHTGACIPIGCKGAGCASQCDAGQLHYDHWLGQVDCTYIIPSMGISIPGKRSFCCNP
jgi:hypothetical protein